MDFLDNLFLDVDCDCDVEFRGISPDLSDVDNGETFEFMGIRFLRLGEEQGGVLCVAVDRSRTVFDSADNPNYEESDIKGYIEGEFLLELYGAALMDFTMDLTSLDGRSGRRTYTAKAGLLSAEQFLKYRVELADWRNSGWAWTCTPVHGDADGSAYVAVVSSSGYVYCHYGYASNANRFCPACIFPI